MKRVIDTSEIIGTLNLADGRRCELCASAVARYDESAGRLVVELTAFLRPVGSPAKAGRLRADWLPGDQTVTESVDWGESVELARDVFHRWVRRVREAAPALHPV